METKAKIRRMRNVQVLSIKSIAKKLGIARNTVRSVLRAEAITQGYKRKTVLSKLCDYESTLEEWLMADKVLSKKQRPEAKHYYERLQALGYQGSYDALCRFIRHWKGAQPSVTATYVPLSFCSRRSLPI